MSHDIDPTPPDKSREGGGLPGDGLPAQENHDWARELGFCRVPDPSILDNLPFPPGDPRRDADFDWALNDPEVYRQYGGLKVAVHERRVWGAGRTYQLAREDALKKPGCPPAAELVFVYLWGTPVPIDIKAEGRRS
jgi:hypothetical protein